MHIIGIRKFCCIYQIVKEVDFFQIKRSYNPFKPKCHFCLSQVGSKVILASLLKVSALFLSLFSESHSVHQLEQFRTLTYLLPPQDHHKQKCGFCISWLCQKVIMASHLKASTFFLNSVFRFKLKASRKKFGAQTKLLRPQVTTIRNVAFARTSLGRK